MQATSTTKKGFKCPTFSVPAKTISDTGSSKTQDENKREAESKPKKTATHSLQSGSNKCKPLITPSGDGAACEEEETDSRTDLALDLPVTESGDGGQQTQQVNEGVKKKKGNKFEVKPVALDSTDQDQEKEGKKRKSESEVGSENKIKASKQEKKEKKPKQEKVPKPQKETKVKKDKVPKEKKEALPVRSLTDEEYDAIFTAAVEKALNINMEDWEPKCSSSVKVKESIKKKCCITVGRKTPLKPVSPNVPKHKYDVDQSDSDSETSSKAVKLKSMEEETEKESTKKDKDENHTEVAAGLDSDEADQCIDEHGEQDEEKSNVDGDSSDSSGDEQEEQVVAAGEVNQEPPVLEMESDTVQQENEKTPAGSMADLDAVQDSMCVTPPPKKKKKAQSSKKSNKLEPRQLPFASKENNEPADKPAASKQKEDARVVVDKVTVKEKIKKLKQMRKEHEVPRKKKKIVSDIEMKPETKLKKQNSSSKNPDVITQPKSKISEKKLNKKKLMLERELNNDGTWVQCSYPSCLKWRHLPDVCDPSQVPDKWTCSMNTREDYNSCDKAEEKYDETEHIYTQYTEGSVVWAKMPGYPWWPAMVELDPDVETYFNVNTLNEMIPTHYHVVFFDDKVSRAWIRTGHVKIFTGKEEDDGMVIPKMAKKGPNYTKEITVAKKNALRAFSCNLKERIELFGFAVRYKGSWGRTYVDSSTSGHDNEDSKPKKRLKKKHYTKPDSDALLDESTMDDVLHNTEALLDNVEEMLESVDSQLDDSDADSDFIPTELVIVETKKKLKKDTRHMDAPSSSSKTTKAEEPKLKKKKPKIILSDSESETTELHHNETQRKKDKPDEKDDCKSVKDETVAEKMETSAEKPQLWCSLKLDSDIFTMEIDDGELLDKENDKIQETIDTDKTTVQSKTKKAVTGGKSERKKVAKKSFAAPAVKDEKSENHTKRLNKTKKSKTLKNEVSKEVIGNMEINIQENNTKLKDDLVKNKKSEKKRKNPVSDGHNEKIKIEAQPNVAEVNNEDIPILEKFDEQEESNLSGMNMDETDHLLSGNKEDKIKSNKINSKKFINIKDRATKPKSIEQNKGSNKLDSDDDFDLFGDMDKAHNETENADNDSWDELDLCGDDGKVPDVTTKTEIQDRNTQKDRLSLEEESDNELDLEEHSMYDGVEDGADKVIERDVVHVLPVGMAYSEEDSDPFDLMEE